MADETSAVPDHDLLWREKVLGPMSSVESFNGRTGVVTSQSGDYAASQVTNDSSVLGATVKAALEALQGAIPSVPVTSVFGRIGAITAQAADYLASQITNDSIVPGLSVSQALNNLLAAIPSVPVASVFGRIGAVVGQAGDYDASEVSNDSSVSGASVKDALNTLLSAIGVTSVFGRTGAVVATTGDYNAQQVSNNSSVTGSSVRDALNTLLAAIPSVPVASVFGRTGAVIAAAGDYGSSQITNGSSVVGATVTAALNALLAASGVTTVFGRSGAVVSASGDYAASQITNDSSVAGADVKLALNALLAQKGARDPIWDPPTVASPDDEEFNTDVLNTVGSPWTIALAGSIGTPMIRDGAIDLTQSIASGHFRSSCIGSALYVQIRQNEEVFVWKTIAGALSNQQLWFAGVGFQTEWAANTTDPRASLQMMRNNAGAPSFADRVFIRTRSNTDSYEFLSVAGGVTVTNIASNGVNLLPVEALALRINHGSSAANNCGGFAYKRNGNVGVIMNGNSNAAYNAATEKIAFDFILNTAQPPVGGVNAAIFVLHFLRRVNLAGGWIAQS